MDARIPVVEGRGAGLAFDVVGPGVLPGRLIKVPMNHQRERHLSFPLEVPGPRQQGVLGLLHHRDAPLADGEAEGVARQIVADVIAFADAHVLVHDGPEDPGVAPHVDVVEQQRFAHLRPGVHEHVAPQHRILDESAGHDASTRKNRLHGDTATSLLVEHQLGGRVRKLGGHDGPVPVVEVQAGDNVLQVHVGLVKGVDGPHVPPVGVLYLVGHAADAVVPEVVGEDPPRLQHRRQDVPPEVVIGLPLRVGAQLFNQRARAGRHSCPSTPDSVRSRREW